MFAKFVASESGLETVEYAVLCALLVAGIVVAIGLLVSAIGGLFGRVSSTLSSEPA